MLTTESTGLRALGMSGSGDTAIAAVQAAYHLGDDGHSGPLIRERITA